jgi:hypothetical protein
MPLICHSKPPCGHFGTTQLAHIPTAEPAAASADYEQMRANSASADTGGPSFRANVASHAMKIKHRTADQEATEGLDGHLRSHLDHPAARNLEIIGRIIGGTAERYEEVILPARHSGMRGWLQRAP